MTQTNFSRTTQIAILCAAFAGMGLSMPGCPGTQALQQQVETLKTSEAELKGRLDAMETSNKSLKDEFTQAKTLLAQVSTTVLEHGETLKNLTAPKVSHPAPKATKSSKSAKSGKRR